MKIADIHPLDFEAGGETGLYKYLAFTVSVDGESRRIIRTADEMTGMPMHGHIFEKVREEFPVTGFKTSDFGGGRITAVWANKRILVSGESLTYGPDTDRHATLTLLSEAFPGFRIMQE